ncbi:MAG: transcription elongation factor GreA [Anaerolineales bacterium]
MSEEKFLTPEGKAKLEQELAELRDVRRPEIAQKLKEAIAEGDLKENANYHDAKEQQALLESRIRDLENTLRYATVIDKADTGRVHIGSQVTLVEDGEEPETFRIVGAAEADPRTGAISNESPIGAALLNKKAGDKVRVQTPAGEIFFTIQAVE